MRFFGFILFVLCFVALSHAAYQIQYSAYTDNTCNKVNSGMTGQIFEGVCAPENTQAHRTGKITFISAEYLTSCDYSDLACSPSAQLICENYNNSKCYGSTSAQFSNKYSWVSDNNGGWTIMYTAFKDQTCMAVDYAGQIFSQKCSAEFGTVPSAGKITYITDNWLISCDYSDLSCNTQVICENYTNSRCNSPDPLVSFSDKYSWTRTDAPTTAPVATTAPTSAPSNTGSNSGNNDGSKDWDITYTGFEDNTCSMVDKEVTGPIFAYKCAPEFRKAPQSGKITKINKDKLTSCDYSDNQCATQTICEEYNNGQCYSSEVAEFSNKYSWVPLEVTGMNNDTWYITYTSYATKNCPNDKVDVQGPIFEGKCAEEFREAPQSGMITFINEEYLTSCDYSDSNCKDLILCENYNNSDCYASSVTSFSNMYSWKRSTSSASSVAACVLLSVAALAFAMF